MCSFRTFQISCFSCLYASCIRRYWLSKAYATHKVSITLRIAKNLSAAPPEKQASVNEVEDNPALMLKRYHEQWERKEREKENGCFQRLHQWNKEKQLFEFENWMRQLFDIQNTFYYTIIIKFWWTFTVLYTSIIKVWKLFMYLKLKKTRSTLWILQLDGRGGHVYYRCWREMYDVWNFLEKYLVVAPIIVVNGLKKGLEYFHCLKEVKTTKRNSDRLLPQKERTFWKELMFVRLFIICCIFYSMLSNW